MLYISFCMAIDAPWHPHRRNTSNAVHRLHGSVTFLTLDVRLDVSFMCKVNKVGNIVHFDPRNRFTVLPVGSEFQNLRSITDVR